MVLQYISKMFFFLNLLLNVLFCRPLFVESGKCYLFFCTYIPIKDVHTPLVPKRPQGHGVCRGALLGFWLLHNLWHTHSNFFCTWMERSVTDPMACGLKIKTLALLYKHFPGNNLVCICCYSYSAWTKVCPAGIVTHFIVCFCVLILPFWDRLPRWQISHASLQSKLCGFAVGQPVTNRLQSIVTVIMVFHDSSAL